MSGIFGDMSPLGTATSNDSIVTADESTADKTSQVQFSGNSSDAFSGAAGWIPVQHTVDSVSALLSVEQEGHAATTGFYSAGDGGGQIFYWDPARSKTDHNGGTVIDPSTTIVPGAAGWWTTTSASGTGCWVATNQGYVGVVSFGAKVDPLYDNASAVNEAIAAVSLRGGGRVSIPSGTLVVKDYVLMKSNVELSGVGFSSIIRAEFDAPVNRIITSDPAAMQYNVKIKNLSVDRTHTNSQHGILLGGIENLIIDNIKVYGPSLPTATCGALGISPFDEFADLQSKNVCVKNCLIDKPNNFGIQFGNVDGGEITDNNITNGYRENIGLESYGAGGKVENVTVTGNNIIITENSNFLGGSVGPAVLIGGSTSGGYVNNIVFSDNTIIGTETVNLQDFAGIKLVGAPTNYVENVLVSDNTVINMNGSGFAIGALGYLQRDIVFSNNYIKDCNQGEIADKPAVGLRNVSGVTISSNTIKGSNHYYLVKESGGSDGNVFINNVGSALTSDFLFDGTTSIGEKYYSSYKAMGSGVVYTETLVAADGETITFTPRGALNRGMYLLSTSFGQSTNAILIFDNILAPIEIYAGSAFRSGATNPAIAGAVNMWPATGTTISLLNNLGSSRKFTLTSFATE